MDKDYKKLTKSATDRMICGVCGGVGEYLKIDPTVVRILWVIFSMMGGAGILAYIIAAIIMGQSFFSWDCHHIVYWLVTPPLTGWKSNAVRLLPTAKNSRTI